MSTYKTENIDFRKKFYNYYHSEVIPKLDEFENKRKLTILFALIIGTLISVFIYSLLKDTQYPIMFLIPSLIVYVLVFSFAKKIFENNLKTKVMGSLLKAFGDDFVWSDDSDIDNSLLKSANIFRYFNKKDSDDNFSGTYKGIKLEISECSLCEEKKVHRTVNGQSRTETEITPVFKGLIVHMNMNKNFTGHTTVIPHNEYGVDHGGLQEVILEDPEFIKNYKTYSTDQIEARYLLTPSFMERYKNLKNVFNSNKVSASFKNNKVLIAIEVYKDLFSLGNLFKSVKDSTQYEELFNEFVAVLSFIDVLKLDLKIGL